MEIAHFAYIYLYQVILLTTMRSFSDNVNLVEEIGSQKFFLTQNGQCYSVIAASII